MKYLAGCLAALFAATGSAQPTNQPIIYPAAGQSTETQNYDRYQCHRWAIVETGVDPHTLTPPSPTREVFHNADSGATGRGTLVGTLAGAALGKIIEGDDSAALPGAIIGASIGSIVGANRENKGANTAKTKAKSRAQVLQQEQDAFNAQKASYQRAFLACMEGRSYIIR